MQQPHPDHTQPSIQFSNQQYQQLQPPMMLCPVGVQFVYEPQMMVPPDEPAQQTSNQTFQNQAFLLNVQNTPPWIQNRPNMVYMPQMQMTSNIQPYIPQQMMQNPMYNYQYQPMLMQEQLRHILPNYINQNVMQNPQMVQNVIQNPQIVQNMTQNPPTLVQNQQNVINTQNVIQSPVRFQQAEQKRESPLLTHMLQNHANKSANQNEFVSPMQIIRPQYQNLRPQMIIVNPITNHTCTHNQIKEPPPVIPDKPQPSEIPQHIRNQIPEGLSVKTVFKVGATALVKPTDYALQNIAPADEAHPRVYPKQVSKPVLSRDPQTNYKRKIKELLEQNTKDEGEIHSFKRNYVVKPETNKNTKLKIYLDLPTNNSVPQTNLNTGPVIDRLHNMQNGLDRPQTEEKLLRNTVYVQARGRVNEMVINDVQNTNIASQSIIEANNAAQMQHSNMENASIANQVGTEGNTPNQVVPEDRSSEVKKEEAVTENNSQKDEVKVTQTIISNDGGAFTQNNSKMTRIVSSMNDGTMSQNSTIQTQVFPSNNSGSTISQNSSKNTQIVPSNDSVCTMSQNSSIKTQVFPSNNSGSTMSLNSSKKTQIVPSNNTGSSMSQNCSINTQVVHSNAGGSSVSQNNSKMSQIVPSNDGGGPVSQNSSIKTQVVPSNNGGSTRSQNSSINTQIVPSNESDGTVSQNSSKKTIVPSNDGVSQNSSKMTQILPSNNADDTTIRNNSKMTKILLSNDADGVQNNSKVTEVSLSNYAHDATTRNSSKMTQMLLSDDAENNNAKNSKKIKMTHKVNKNTKTKTKKNVSVHNCINEPIGKYVLTHVLDGHIIQESNVPFVVQKPTLTHIEEPPNKIDEAEPEAELSKETESLNNIDDSKNSLNIGETESPTDTIEDTLKTNNRDPKLDVTDSKTGNDVNEDDPFEHLSRATVKSWSVADVTSHLMNHQDWRESAQKLKEEEIDGESLFLVNKDQLLHIGICEEHAQVLSEFLARE